MISHAFEFGEMDVRLSAISSAESRYVPSPLDRTDVLGSARIGRSPRFGDQSYFWTQSWQQAERLADYDLLASVDHQPKDIADLFEWLDSDD